MNTKAAGSNGDDAQAISGLYHGFSWWVLGVPNAVLRRDDTP